MLKPEYTVKLKCKPKSPNIHVNESENSLTLDFLYIKNT